MLQGRRQWKPRLGRPRVWCAPLLARVASVGTWCRRVWIPWAAAVRSSLGATLTWAACRAPPPSLARPRLAPVQLPPAPQNPRCCPSRLPLRCLWLRRACATRCRSCHPLAPRYPQWKPAIACPLRPRLPLVCCKNPLWILRHPPFLGVPPLLVMVLPRWATAALWMA